MNHPGEQTVIAQGPQPPRPGKSVAIDRALRVVDAGPRYLYRAALVSLAGTCLLTIAVALAVRPAGPLPKPQQELILAGLAGLLGTGVLMFAAVVWPAARRTAALDRVVDPEQRAAVWLALAIWFPLLLVVAYYRAKSTLPSSVVWIAFGYLDKRWVTACYLVGALAPILLVVASARVLIAGRAHPVSWRAWLSALAPARRTAGQADDWPDDRPDDLASPAPTGAEHAAPRSWWGARWISVVVGVLTALGLAYYFYGPPWFLNRTSGAAPVSLQEDVFLSGLQAISKGATPYIGPAAVQYGPGTQLLSYFYMRHIGTFSVVGFRESWALFEWAGASIFFVVLFLALGYGRGLAATLMTALIYPALQLVGFGFLTGGSYSGFFGWANPLRYAGAIALILLLPAVIRRAPSWRGLTGAAVLGLLWGWLSYMAQENLVAGAVGAIVIGALLLLSGTAAWRSVWTSLLAVLGGFVVSWLPALVYYASKGLLGRFLYLYFLITRAVAQGYSNTPYGGVQPTKSQIAYNAPWQTFFYVLPFVLALLALLAVVQFRPFRIAMEWSRERIMVVAVVVTAILMYQGALLRSDADHLTGTLLVVPALVVTLATLLPRLLGAHRRATLVLAGAAVVIASFALLPYHAYNPSRVRAEAVAPYNDRQRLAAQPTPAEPATVAARQVGAGLANIRDCCRRGDETMRHFIGLMNQIHAAVGDRTTYVAGFSGGYPGLIYFAADLRPAPVPLDLRTMVFTTAQRLAYLRTFRTSVLPRTQAIVARNLRGAEVRAFLLRYPQARKIVLTYLGKPYYVLLAP
jgi:hypothetical protein